LYSQGKTKNKPKNMQSIKIDNKRLFSIKPGLAIIAALAVGLSGANAVVTTVSNNVTGSRVAKDVGTHLLQVDLLPNSTGSANITYDGGDLNGKWADISWNFTRGGSYITVSKHKNAASPGYPKLVDSITGPKVLSYTGKAVGTISGSFQSGAYVWLDDNNTGLGTHEINIWNHTASLTRNYTVVGTYSADGTTYKVYKSQNSGFFSWYFIRQTRTYNMNLDIKAIFTYLRTKGLPNHNVIGIMAAIEGSNGSGNGRVLWTNINIPSL
jgi:Glycosyl hydrolase family 12